MRRELVKAKVDVDRVDTLTKAAKAAAEVEAKAQPGFSKKPKDAQAAMIATLFEQKMAASYPDYPRYKQLVARALQTVRGGNKVHVWAHLDVGHVTANSRLAEFKADASNVGSAAGVRTSLHYVLASRIAQLALEVDRRKSFSQAEIQDIVASLGNKVIAVSEMWKYPKAGVPKNKRDHSGRR